MLVYRKLFYSIIELSAIAEFIEEAEEERGGICRSKTSVSVHNFRIPRFPFSYKEWVSSPGLLISIDLTSLSGIGKGSSVNESIYYIPLLFPLFLNRIGLVLVSVFVAELRSKGALGKSPTGFDRPTAEMPLLESLKFSTLQKGYEIT